MKRYIRSASQKYNVITINDVEDWKDFYKTTRYGNENNGKTFNFDIPDDEVLINLYRDIHDFLYHLRYLAVKSSFKQIKERLSKLISYYDGFNFKPTAEMIQQVAYEASQTLTKAPYRADIQTKPTSVFILIKPTKRELANMDIDEAVDAIDDYAEYLQSLPSVGYVDNRASQYIKHHTPGENVWFPIQLYPAANR